MIPDELEARLAGRQEGATVAAVLEELRADPDWRLTTVELGGRIVHVELVYVPTGQAYTLTARRRGAVGGHAQQGDT